MAEHRIEIKEMSNEVNKDCLSCRLVSGFGVMGMGAYIYTQSSNRSKIQMVTMRLLALSAVGLGFARLLNMPFLKSKKNKNQ